MSRRFVALSSERLEQWLASRLDHVRLPVVMIDGIHFKDRVVLVALGFDTDGRKHVLGMREGSTENTRVVRSLISDLIERGLDADTPQLWIIDGGKALRRAIIGGLRRKRTRTSLSGAQTPQRARPSAGASACERRTCHEATRGTARMPRSPSDSSSGWPIRSPRRIRRRRKPARGACRDAHAHHSRHRWLRSTEHSRTTNPIENLNGLIAHYTRNVKRWRDGAMVLRWIGTALHEATGGFRAVRGFRDIKRLVAALEEHVQLTTHMERKIA